MDFPGETIGHKESYCFLRGVRISIIRKPTTICDFSVEGGGGSRTLPPLLICMLLSRLKLSNLERTKLVEGSILFWVFDSAHVVLGSCLALWNRFKPSSKIFSLTVPRRCFFCGSFMLCFCLVFVMLSCASVYWCLVVTCWERAKLLSIVCDVYFLNSTTDTQT